MSRLLSWFIALWQFLPMPGPSVSSSISYCSTPGYPAAPFATGLVFQYKAGSMSNCDGMTHQTSWLDSSGNAHTATAQSGTYVICSPAQVNGLPAVDTTTAAAWFAIGGSTTSSDLHTIFALTKTSTDNRALLSGNGGSGALSYGFGISGAVGGRQTIFATGTPDFITGGTTTALIDGNWHSLMAQETGSGSGVGFTRIFHVDRTVDPPIDASAPTNVNVPQTLFFDANDGCCKYNGLVAEILYYNTQLSASEIVYNECYIYGKYNQ